MIIRIRQGAKGIVIYLVLGQKKGRAYTRDELDQRQTLYGNLNTLEKAITYIQQHKKWKNNYWHITIGFSIENNSISKNTMKNIVEDMLSHYFHLYKKENIIAYAEAHYPKIQSLINYKTKKLEQRLLHIHLVISKLNLETDNQLNMLPFFAPVDKAFQALLCQKHKIIKPIVKNKISNKSNSIITDSQHIQTVLRGLSPINLARKSLIFLSGVELLTINKVKTQQQLKTYFNNHEWVKSCAYKESEQYTYLQVQCSNKLKFLPDPSQEINMKGKGFEHLNKIYNNFDQDYQLTQQLKPANLIALHKKKHKNNQYQYINKNYLKNKQTKVLQIEENYYYTTQ